MNALWQKFLRRWQSPHHRRFAWIVGALLLSLWLMVAAWSYWERQEVLANNARALQQIATSANFQAKGLFRQAESSLAVANHWLSTHPQENPATAPDFLALTNQLRRVSHGLLDIRMAAPDGAVHYVPETARTAGVSIRDREYFQVQLNPKTRGFYIGTPVLSRVTGKWDIPVSSAVEVPNKWIAVLYIAIDLDRIASEFDTRLLLASGTIGLVRQDGVVLYRSPYQQSIIGQSLKSASAWSQYQAAPSSTVIYTSKVSLFDGLTRAVAFSALDDYPVVVYASNDQQQQLAGWRVNTALRFAVALLITLFCSVLGLALLRALGASQVAEAIIRSTEDAIVGKNLEGIITSWNPGAQNMFGYTAEEILGQSILRLIPPERQAEEAAIVDKIRRGASVETFETMRLRKDGSSVYVVVTISPIRDSLGELIGISKIARDNTALKLQQQKLEHNAHFDALTNLPNRLLLSDRLDQAMSLCERNGTSLAVLYLDLDGFKLINDRFGHAMGDQVLVEVSQRMRQALRDSDTLARMGGDEFVAVLAGIESPQACIPLIQRVLDACAAPVVVGTNEMRVTASVGVTLFPLDSAGAEQLMRHADQAMYEAKQRGKNRFHLFDPAQDAHAKSLGVQQERIEQALVAGEFVLFYQPKVHMQAGRVVGAEALIRWQHPELGLLAPAAFLPAIETSPLTEAVGLWVMETALQQMSLWKREGLDVSVSVNVAARQLQQDDFVQTLATLLRKYPEVDAHCLELEVLETSALTDIASTAGVIDACQALGVCFAIDDFGTGYSSLTYLRHLSVQTLKIDQTFVRNMLVDASDLSIVNGVIGLAAAFHREVIAEGVETEQHGTRLLELGCYLAQGYAIARPMPAHLFADWCASWTPPVAWTGALELAA